MVKTWTALPLALFALIAASPAGAQTLREEIDEQLKIAILADDTPLQEVQTFTASRVIDFPEVQDVETWEQTASNWREDTLENIVFRGDIAKNWRDAETQVVWSDTINGGAGYSIRKLRYEALPGLWIPALLYLPDNLVGQVPVVLNVSGHDKDGKATDFKQIRCINQAKRGMIALNTEWFGFGQLESDGFNHSLASQLDLCGASALAPHYLGLSRALDLLLDHPNADASRVAVTGLSGGGWQTITISALDPRVTLCNPVAGYSSLKTRAFQLRDLGDPEQMPNDLATVVDYPHLTAMLAPRPALLTYNAADRCCFVPETALPPLLDAANPVYTLYEKSDHLRQHINVDPGTHNFEQDNREALYQILGDFFFSGDADYATEEIDSSLELKTGEELSVPIPDENLDFAQLAMLISSQLPKEEFLPPSDGDALENWQVTARMRLAQIVKFPDYGVSAEKVGENTGAIQTDLWKLSLDDKWTLPMVEFTPLDGATAGTTVVVGDNGRSTLGATIEALLESRHRVLAIDPFYFGESTITTASVVKKDWLFALLVGAVGERPLGIQSGQVAAVARWASTEFNSYPIDVQAFGKHASLFSTVAACLEPEIADVIVHNSMASLKEILTEGETALTTPGLFCFGLLEQFDISQLTQLALSTPTLVHTPTIDWPTPEPITFGNALGSQQLSATAITSGTFTYTPPEGTVPDAGNHTLTVQFDPDDSIHYGSATSEVVITVSPGTPVIIWEDPFPILFGTTLGAEQFNASADVPGSFDYHPPIDTILPTGNHLLSVTFTPDDDVNLTPATKEVSLTVNRQPPVVIWPLPDPLVFGTELGEEQLNATSSVPGTFTYEPPLGTNLMAGSHTLSVNFVPSDTSNFGTATKEAILIVEPLVPTLNWHSPDKLIFGTELTPEHLNATSDVPGMLRYDPPLGHIFPAGNHTLSVSFTPVDKNNFTEAILNVPLIVEPASPIITWSMPSPITFGTRLNGNQLNATANVPGSFSYDPPKDFILDAGNKEISLTFTATDSANYESIAKSVVITVERTVPELSWEMPLEMAFGAAIGPITLPFTADIPGSFTYDPPVGSVLEVGTHTLNVTFVPNNALNYRSKTVRTTVLVVDEIGDFNGDGILTALDVDSFIDALISPGDYAARTGRDPLTGDINRDRELSSDDIDGFVLLMRETGNLSQSELKRLDFLSALKSPGEDDDRDGSNNAQELYAGTNPYDASDRFKISSLLIADGTCTVEWASVPGKSYVIESSVRLTDSWHDILDTTFTATERRTRHIFPAPAVSRGNYYRVRLAWP